MKMLLRWVIAAVALWIAVTVVDGVTVVEDGANPIVTYALLALVLGIVMALVKPVLTLLTCPLQIITLGLFSLVVNAVAFWLSSVVAGWFNLGFIVDGFVPALLGSLVYSVITAVAGMLIDDRT